MVVVNLIILVSLVSYYRLVIAYVNSNTESRHKRLENGSIDKQKKQEKRHSDKIRTWIMLVRVQSWEL